MKCFFINELRPSLNVKSDAIRAKFFLSFLILLFLHAFYFSYHRFLHFHTLHTFTSLFYIYTDAKIFIFNFKLENETVGRHVARFYL